MRSKNRQIFIIVYKKRLGHDCNNTYIVVAILEYNALDQELSSKVYTIMKTVTKGMDKKRSCEKNSRKSCKCQWTDYAVSGQNFTWGCNSIVYNYLLCKFTHF